MPKKRLAIGVVLSTLGAIVAALNTPQHVESNGERSRSAIRRTTVPIATVPVQRLSAARDYTLNFVVPSDEHWNRIKRELGTPLFLVTVVADDRAPRPDGPADVGLHAQAAANSRPLELTPTSERAFGHAPTTHRSVYKFAANSSDRVQLRLRVRAPVPPVGGRVVVLPYWNPLIIQQWVDSATTSQRLHELFAPGLSVFGLMLVASGFFLLLSSARPISEARRDPPSVLSSDSG